MEKIQLQSILKMCDEAVGYQSELHDKNDHVIAKRTWSKYVQDYNQNKEPNEKIQKFGETSSARYLKSDVEKVIEFKKDALEKRYVKKTMLLFYDPKFEREIDRKIKKRVKDSRWKIKNALDEAKKKEAHDYLDLTIAEKWNLELREYGESKGADFSESSSAKPAQRITRKSVEKKMQELSIEDELIGEEIVENCKEKILSMFDIEAFAQDIYDDLYVFGEHDEFGKLRREKINNPLLYLKSDIK